MPKKTIQINPATMAKEDYDIQIDRHKDDVEWVAPPGAVNLVIHFYSPHNHLSPGNAPKALRRVFSKTAHGNVKRIKYRIEIEYASGIFPIDPFVIIQP